MGSAVVTKDNTYKPVASLGWLLRNWKSVDFLLVIDEAGIKATAWESVYNRPWVEFLLDKPDYASVALVAVLRPTPDEYLRYVVGDHNPAAHRYYLCWWYSPDTLEEWLSRPVFRGVRIKWYNRPEWEEVQ